MENFQFIPTLHIIWIFCIVSEHFPKYPEILQQIMSLMQKFSGQHCWRADGVFLTLRNCSLLLKKLLFVFSPQWWKSTRCRTRSWPHHFWAPRKSPGWREIWNLEREVSGWRKIQNIEREVWVEENIDFRMGGVRFNLLYKSSKYKPYNLEGSHRLWRRVQEDLYLHLQGKDGH